MPVLKLSTVGCLGNGTIHAKLKLTTDLILIIRKAHVTHLLRQSTIHRKKTLEKNLTIDRDFHLGHFIIQ